MDGNGSAPTDGRPTAVVVKDLIAGAQTLMRQEVDLAKAELKEGLTAKGQAAGAGAVAGVLGLYLIGFLGMALGTFLGTIMAQWAAWLIVAGIVLVLILVLGLVARAKARKPMGVDTTKQRIQEDLAWARTLKRR